MKFVEREGEEERERGGERKIKSENSITTVLDSEWGFVLL